MNQLEQSAVVVAVTALLTLGGLSNSAQAKPPQSHGPWDLSDLRQVPPVRWRPTDGSLRSLTFQGEPYQGKPTEVFAFYGTPKDLSQPVPAIVLVHGGGGRAFKEWVQLWVDRGYAALAMDLAGRGPDGKRLPMGGPDQSHTQKFQDIDGGIKNAWPYHAVANVVRAVSLIQSFPETDPQRVGITGISWGGYLTCLVSGLDDRLKVAVPVYGCGYLHQNSAWLNQLANLPPEHRQLWIQNFDPSAYLSQARMPMLFINGTNDFAYPLDSYQKSYRLVPGQRTLCVTVKMPHGHKAGWARPEIALFVDSVLRDGTRLTQVEAQHRDDSTVTVDFSSQVPITSAALHTTTDKGPWKKRSWKSTRLNLGSGQVTSGQVTSGQVTSGQVTSGKITATLPAESGLVYFLTLTDQRGATVSTEHVVLP